MQRALLLFGQPEQQSLVRKALKKAGREDLIGWGRQYLVPPEGEPPKTRRTQRKPADRLLAQTARKGRRR